MREVDSKLMRWMVQTVETLNAAKPVLDLEYGTYYLGDIPVQFDGEATEYFLGISEFSDEYVIKIKDPSGG